MKLSFKWYLFRWFRGWAALFSGLAQIISFGFWEPCWSLKMDNLFMTEAERLRDHD